MLISYSITRILACPNTNGLRKGMLLEKGKIDADQSHPSPGSLRWTDDLPRIAPGLLATDTPVAQDLFAYARHRCPALLTLRCAEQGQRAHHCRSGSGTRTAVGSGHLLSGCVLICLWNRAWLSGTCLFQSCGPWMATSDREEPDCGRG